MNHQFYMQVFSAAYTYLTIMDMKKEWWLFSTEGAIEQILSDLTLSCLGAEAICVTQIYINIKVFSACLILYKKCHAFDVLHQFFCFLIFLFCTFINVLTALLCPGTLEVTDLIQGSANYICNPVTIIHLSTVYGCFYCYNGRNGVVKIKTEWPQT